MKDEKCTYKIFDEGTWKIVVEMRSGLNRLKIMSG
jgi:hypothetical protein